MRKKTARVGKLTTRYYGDVLAVEYSGGSPYIVLTTEDGYDFDDSKAHGMLFHQSGDAPSLSKARSYWFADGYSPSEWDVATGTKTKIDVAAVAKRVGATILPAPLNGDPFEDARDCDHIEWCDICKDLMPDDDESLCRHLFWVDGGNGVGGPGQNETIADGVESRFMLPVVELACRAGIVRQWRALLASGKLEWSHGFMGGICGDDVRSVGDEMEDRGKSRVAGQRAWGWFKALDERTVEANRVTIEWLDLVIAEQDARRASGAAVYALRGGGWNPEARYSWDDAVEFAKRARTAGKGIRIAYVRARSKAAA